MTKRISTIALAAVCLLAAAAAAAADLDGLWSAKKRFGPEVRGTLILERNGDAYSADVAGMRVAVAAAPGELAFDLPGDRGSFRGKLQPDGSILGTWTSPPGLAHMVGTRLLSPVRLLPDGANRWRGEVDPFEELFTFFLKLTKRPDGAFDAFLHNPERQYAAEANRLVRDGNAVKLLGTREWAAGTYDPDRDVLTLTFGRGGTFELGRDGDASAFYPRGKNPGRYVYHPPPARDDGWPVGTLDEANIDRAAIERFVQMIVDMPMESPRSPQVHALLIARHGKLVLEEYFHGEHRDKLHETRSAAKSLTATVVGAALAAGAPLSLSSPVYKVMNGGDFPAGLEPRKRAMTLEHLLTMSSGYFCDDTDPAAPGNEETMSNGSTEPDYYKFTLRVPMESDPGTHAVYCSAVPNLALGMVARATGESPAALFDRLIGVPMKIRRYAWPTDPAGHPYGGGSMQVLPRDFMKLGQLMLNGGTWDGRRILDPEFARRGSSPLVDLRNIQYGYFWWNLEVPYKNRAIRAFYAGGAGGQGVIVFPELDLVVASFAANFVDRVQLAIQQELVPRYILPAVRENGDDPKAPVAPVEFVSPYGRQAKSVELDHILLHVSPNARERAALEQAGFRAAPNVNRHEGQGSASITFEFENSFLELVWRDKDVSVAQGLERAAEKFAKRSDWRASGWSPIGIALHRVGVRKPLPVATWSVTAPWMDPGTSLEMLTPRDDERSPSISIHPHAVRDNPALDLVRADLRAAGAMTQPNGVRRITAVKLLAPPQYTPIDAVRLLERDKVLTLGAASEWAVELTFDGGAQKKERDFRPQLPLVVKY